MQYRYLGNTGIRVSELGLGCEGFNKCSDEQADEMFAMALKGGINCMDMYTPNPAVHRRFARTIGPVRDSFVLQAHLCTKWENEQYSCTRKLDEVKKAFEIQLGNLGTDYLDIGMIHYVDSVAAWQTVIDNGILEYACELKKEGRIKAVGMSSHNPQAALAAVRTGRVDVIMFSVNPCYDLLPGGEDCEDLWSEKSYSGVLTNFDPQRVELYETCQRMGVGITVMKAFGGGDLLNAEDSPAGMALSSKQCLHYALTRPAVGAVMAGVRSIEELEDVLSYEDAGEAEKDYATAFARFPRIRWQGHCMYCGHCAPCPMGIKIADVMKLYNLARGRDEIPETVAQHYSVLERHAGDCVGCGACEKRCPFDVAIRENMNSAKALFGY